MLSIILGFITGLAGPIASVVGKISDLQIAKVNAASNVEKAHIDAQIEEAHDRKAILIAEAGNRIACLINSVTRLVLTVGPASVLLKIFLWDKVVGSFYGCAGRAGNAIKCATFNTDPLDTNLWYVILAVIAFYFSYDIASRMKQ